MRIGILGTGNMAATLGGVWRRAGHDVLVGGRNPASGGATLRDAATHGELVLLAVPDKRRSADGGGRLWPALFNGAQWSRSYPAHGDSSRPSAAAEPVRVISRWSRPSAARLVSVSSFAASP
ncbi:NAD(P)-binding domain-containing protein [Dactylosporangium darangshiense]